MVTRTAPVLLALVLVLAAGCAPEREAIGAGVCVASEKTEAGKRIPDLSSIVPCTSSHRYEVYDVVDLPDREDLQQRAQRRCATSLLSTTGYDALTVNGKNAAAVGLLPAIRGIEAPLFAVTPEQRWQAGRRQVICMARMTVPVQAASGKTLLVSMASSPAFPVALRPCRAYDADRRAIADAPCSRRHVSELLFTFEADKALGRKFVASVVRDPTADKFDRLDALCAKALPQLLGKGYDKDLRGFGSVARRWTLQWKTVRCDVGPKEFRTMDLPPGSLVGTDGLDVKFQSVP